MSAVRRLLGLSDLRFAARRLRRAPGLAAAVVLVLALGVGSATAVFSLVEGILLAPLPFADPDRLVRLTSTVGDGGPAAVELSDAVVLLYQNTASAFTGVAAWRFDDGDLVPLAAEQSAVRVRGARVTASFFEVLGVRPALGRGFAPGEDRPGSNGVAVLSHRVWQERFHGDPAVLDGQIVVNAVPRRIVGVMPPSFAYPAPSVEIWLPLALDPARTHPSTLDLTGIARLRPGVTLAAARADLLRTLPRLGDYLQGDAAAAWQEARLTPHVESLRDSIVGPVSRLLWLLFGAVLLVLLVACTNVAGLLLVRAERAQGELAVRAALGSGLAGLFALTRSESLLLAALGGGGGVLLAFAMTRALASMGPALLLPRLEAVAIDLPVLLFALVTTLLCALLVSVLPLRRARRVSIAEALRRGSSGASGPAAGRARQAIVVAQIALAVVLVATAGLLTRSLLRLQEVRPGFDAARVVTSRVLLPYRRYGGSAPRLGFYAALRRQAEALPGARDVAFTDWVPLSGDRHETAIEIDGEDGGAERPVAHVDGAYFRTLRIPLLRGRTFAAPGAAPLDEAIVSRAFAARHWPGESPLGKRVRRVGGRWSTVVGEVGDVRYHRLEEPGTAILYFPIAAESLPSAVSLLVRTDVTAAETLRDVQGVVRTLDPSIPTYDEAALGDLVRESLARARALVLLLGIASATTSLLGGIGLYGMMAYLVSLRRRELGVRMALGAQPAAVSRAVSLDGLRLTALGIAAGTACTLVASGLLRGLLYGVSPTDPVALLATALALLAVALVASWVPARRAAAVPPAEALRGL